MGYYTRYNLEIEEMRGDLKNRHTYQEVFDLTVAKLHELDVINYALNSNLDSYGEVKWYNHDKHMKILSTEIKDVLFKLSGEGEESGDLWEEYWLNGKHQRCQAELVFPEFDESKLE